MKQTSEKQPRRGRPPKGNSPPIRKSVRFYETDRALLRELDEAIQAAGVTANDFIISAIRGALARESQTRAAP